MKDAIQRFNERRGMPGVKALRDAGPAERRVVAAIVVGTTLAVLLAGAGIWDLRLGLGLPFVATLLVSLTDRDGWRVRMAMSELASKQRRRWTSGSIPMEPSTAEAWLTAHFDGSPLERAVVLQMAGRAADALELIRDIVPSTPEESVKLARMRLILEASAQNRLLDDSELETVVSMPSFNSLPDEERRYQLLSLSWAQAWQAIETGRPWRRAFANRVRDLGPFTVRLPHRLFHASQQLAAPIAFGLVWLGYLVISS